MLAVCKTLSSVAKNWRSKPDNELVLEENNPVDKSGRLLCKRVADENGTKTKKSKRAWKPFKATLQGLDLYLQKDSTSSAEKDISIRLHHALACPVEYKNRPHVLCLRTANFREFYFQAECEAEKKSWALSLNCAAARYSVPPLFPVSHDKNEHSQFLPSFYSHLSHEQQLRCCKDQLEMLSEHLQYYQSLPFRPEVLSVGFLVQQVKNYTTYVTVLQELVAAENAEEVPVNITDDINN